MLWFIASVWETRAGSQMKPRSDNMQRKSNVHMFPSQQALRNRIPKTPSVQLPVESLGITCLIENAATK
jgi:hypothetical protein